MRNIVTLESALKERAKKECEGKKQYQSLQTAARARKKMEEKFEGQQFSEYYCEFCGTFHVGHTRYQHIK